MVACWLIVYAACLMETQNHLIGQDMLFFDAKTGFGLDLGEACKIVLQVSMLICAIAVPKINSVNSNITAAGTLHIG